jgi:hypothetical protein
MFDFPLTPVDEYWIGYFRADGCILRPGKYKNAVFSQVHKEAVEAFAKHIDKKNKVKTYSTITNWGGVTYHVVSSAKVGYILDNLGVKTQLYEPLYKSKHFWRGLLDGNGNIQTNQHGPAAVVRFNGPKYDLEKCQQFIENTLGCQAPNLERHSSIFRITLTGNKAKFFLHILYEDEYSALIYKREKAETIIKMPYFTHSSSWIPPHD